MVRDAVRFLVPLVAAALITVVFGHPVLALACLVLAGYVAYFFRDPRRDIPPGEHRIVSPADGKVVRIQPLPDGTRTVSIFLSIFDVHVNRAPVSARLERLEYVRGKFKPAFDDEASRLNEQNILTLSGPEMRVVVRQIAGLIARRVVCWKKPGDGVQRGERIGLIRFGARVDITLPERVRLLVKVGDRVRGGSSILGEHV